MPIFLARHPQPATHGQGLCIGQTDVGLSPAGEAALDGLAGELAQELRPERILTSDLKRCRLLADAVGARSGARVEADPVWREVDFGDWEGRSWEEIHAENSPSYNAWTADFVHAAPPGGESLFQLSLRVQKALRETCQGGEDARILIVTHAGVIRALCAPSLEKAFDYEVAYGSWRSIERNPHELLCGDNTK